MVRARVGELVESNRFQMFIVGVIVLNAITLGAETSTVLHAELGPALTVIDHLALVIFTVELAARLYAFGWKFFKDPWNVFDFVIVAIALILTAGPLSVLRSLRILRALRLVAMVPSMRRVVTALVKSIPGLLSLSGLLVLLVYVGGVIASNLFGDTGDPRFSGLGPTASEPIKSRVSREVEVRVIDNPHSAGRGHFFVVEGDICVKHSHS